MATTSPGPRNTRRINGYYRTLRRPGKICKWHQQRITVTMMLFYVLFCFIISVDVVSAVDCNIQTPTPATVTENTTVPGHILWNLMFTSSGTVTLDKIQPADNVSYLSLEHTPGTDEYRIVQNTTFDAEIMPHSDSGVDPVKYSLVCPLTQGSPIQFDLVVIVLNSNDHSPVFISTETELRKNVSELTSPGTDVFELKGAAADGDIRDYAITYKISSQDPQYSHVFSMDRVLSSSIGSIVLDVSLDYEDTSQPHEYRYTVTAMDAGSPQHSTNKTLVIRIIDEDDQNPVFNKTDGYNWTVPENTISAASSLQLSAHDQDVDVSPPADINYKIKRVNPASAVSKFSISVNGILSVNEALNREARSEYTIIVEAFQTDNPVLRVATTIVDVTVSDVNDNKPVMSQVKYSVDLQENAINGVTVDVVSASDADEGDSAVVRFHIQGQNRAFNIDNTTGVITVGDSVLLDRESTSNFTFQIYAEESRTTERFRSNFSEVVITLLDENDNSPIFNVTGRHHFTINETDPIGVQVGKVYATDMDLGVNGDVMYFLQSVSPDGPQRFGVDNMTGAISITGDLSQDYQPLYSLTVKAEDRQTNSVLRRFSTTVVTVAVSDVNNNPPSFISSGYTVNITEGSPNVQVILMEAQDADIGGQLSCAIVAGDPVKLFMVSYDARYQGCLVETKGSLDRETTAAYSLTVAVSDGTHSDSRRLNITVIDINDNSPVFDRPDYTFTVDENQLRNTVIGNVNATDADDGRNKDIQYDIADFWKSILSIDPNTGEIRVNGDIDRERTPVLELVVEAHDQGLLPLTNTTSVRITVNDVNDNAPMFRQSRVSLTLKDNSPAQTFYWSHAEDADSDPVNQKTLYRISSGDLTIFQMTSSGNLSTLVPLDLENMAIQGTDSYTLTIEAYNVRPYSNSTLVNATQTLRITVNDENDNGPQFTETVYRFDVLENSAINFTVGRVRVTDADVSPQFQTQRSRFWMEPGNGGQYFYIDSQTGDIKTKKHIDYEQIQHSFLFQIGVTDFDSNTLNDTTSVNITILDVNDNAPNFTQDVYYWEIPEGTDLSTYAVSATDKDMAGSENLEYQLVNPDRQLPFTMEPSTGNVSLTELLDYETTNSYYLTLLAVDHGQPQLTGSAVLNVTVTNVNEQPKFSKTSFNFSVLENVAAGTTIGVVTISDEDGDNITIVVTNSNDFLVVPTSRMGEPGESLEFSIAANKPFDFEVDQTTYSINIRASDDQSSTTAVVTVVVEDVNDHAPNFTRTVYAGDVTENAAGINCVVEIKATDEDSGANSVISYDIVGGSNSGAFKIHQNGSVVEVCVTQPLDYESTRHYQLFITATDGGSPPRVGYSRLEIQVLDVNDEPPRFTQPVFYATISEEQATSIVTLSAEDEDSVSSASSLIYSVVEPTQTGRAASNFSFTGSTLLLSGAGVDRDTSPLLNAGYFLVNVSVSDGKFMDYALVNVTVRDINDNTPVFVGGSLQVIVAQGSNIGDEVNLQMNVIDADPTNAGFTYWMTGDEGKFSMNASSGILSVAGGLESEANREFNLTVFVSDHGVPPRRNFTVVSVVINEVNVYPPVFQRLLYNFSILEGNVSGQLNATVIASDMDGLTKREGQIQFSLVNSNSVPFHIDSSTGEITATDELDRESNCRYHLRVVARDSGLGQKSATANITINVLDVNDNSPIFANNSRNHTAASGLGNATLFRASAIDADCTELCGHKICSVSYTLTILNTTVDQNSFYIDQSTGLVHAVDLKNETIGKLIMLRIEASDGESPPRTASKDFEIYVYSAEEHPKISQPGIISVYENQLRHPILDLNATVGTKGADECLHYSLSMETDRLVKSRYSIEEATGVIFAESLDYETSASDELLVDIKAMFDCDTNRIPNSANRTKILITVHILDINDISPRFINAPYDTVVPENQAIHSVLLTVSAVDGDSSPQFNYSIIRDNSGGKFAMNNTAGEITLDQMLNWDAMPIASDHTYTLTVMVNDGLFNDTSTVLIHVQDVNDLAPEFVNKTLHVQVSEGIRGIAVATVNATDRDAADVGNLKYAILAGDPLGYFSMDQSFGRIQVAKPIDREVTASFDLLVGVRDLAGHTDNMTVYVSVTDINDNAPAFTKSLYTNTTLEGVASLQLQMEVEASDNDIGVNANLTFTLQSGNQASFFNITPTSHNKAVIEVVKQLDRELNNAVLLTNGDAVYEVTVIATDSGANPNTATATVEVTVTDINDNAPEFEQSIYELELSEGAPLGNTVLKVTANDQDYLPSYKQVEYVIDAGNENGTFEINSTTGAIQVVKRLSILEKKIYNLTLIAKDIDDESLVSVPAYFSVTLLDDNDNDPVFSRSVYKFTVSEDDGNATILGRYVGNVIATDLDEGTNGQLSYSITSRSSAGVFNISQTGNITTADNLDRERIEQYIIIVTAEDHGSPTSRKGTCEVMVRIQDVNDMEPELSSDSYHGTVSEGAQNGTRVDVEPLITATDLDEGINQEVSFVLYGEGSDLFDIRMVGPGQGRVIVGTSAPDALDRETKPVYHLQVMAVDQRGQGRNSSASNLTIELRDANDHAPEFRQDRYLFNISEDAAGSEFIVGVVSASDQDLDLYGTIRRYAIISGGEGRFYISMISSPLGESGEIHVTGGLDRERKSEYVMNITAWDGQFEAWTEVTVRLTDLNDNCPVFDQPVYSMVVDEEKVNGTQVGAVHATDIDAGINGIFTFLLVDEGNFAINDTTGLITAASRLDRDVKASYDVRVLAIDEGTPSCNTSVSVHIDLRDINDNAPIFLPVGIAQLHSSILEKSPIDSVIAWPQASDIDEGPNSRLTFHLQGQGVEYFKINPATGLVTIRDRIDLHSLSAKGYISFNGTETNATLILTVTVRDGGSPSMESSIPLRIDIEGISDSAPQFSQTTYRFDLAENMPSGFVVGQLDLVITTLNSTIVAPSPHYSITDNHRAKRHFSVEGLNSSSENGGRWQYSAELKTTDISVDYEAETEFTFVLMAGDGKVPERTAYAVIVVTVTDVNDNVPVCPSKTQVYSVRENETDTILVAAHVTDEDSGRNGQLTYTVESGDTEHFTVNSSTGDLSVMKALNREKETSYTLIIQARDNGAMPRSCTTTVSITVSDINDNPPIFYANAQQTNEFVASMKENEPAGSLVFQVFANDTDEGLNGTVFYRLPSIDDTDYFFINPTDGKLFTVVSLDYEAETSYNVTIEAYDLGTPQMVARAHVLVSIIDVDDTTTWKSMLLAYISRATQLNTVIITVETTEQMYFNITEGNDDGTFSVNSDTGEIVLLKPPAVRSTPFNLTIMATADKPPNTIRYATVLVYVRDTVVTVIYPENQPANHLVIDLNTTEESFGKAVHYSFVDYQYPGIFQLNGSTGEICALVTLDRENVSSYRLQVKGEVTLSSRRQKRAFGDDPSEIVVVVEVGDENDNAPTFGVAKLTFGLPRSASINHLIATLSASDADVGNNSAVVYSVIDGDQDNLELDASTGELRCTTDLSQSLIDRLQVIVNATDNWGQGHSVEVTVLVLVVADSDRAILVVDLPQAPVNKNIKDIKGNLSEILGYDVQVESVDPHIEQTDSGTQLNGLMTDIYIHAIDPDSGNVVSRDQLLRRMAEKDAAIQKLFAKYKITKLTPLSVKHETYEMSLSEIALLALACVIFVGSILAIIVVMYSAKKHDMERLRNQQAEKARANITDVPNPVYTATINETNLDSDSAEPLELGSAINVFDVLTGAEEIQTVRTKVLQGSETESMRSQFDVDPDTGLVFVDGNLDRLNNGRANTSYYADNGLATLELDLTKARTITFESQELKMELFGETSDYEEGSSEMSGDGNIVASSTEDDDGQLVLTEVPAFPAPFRDSDRSIAADSGNVTEAEVHEAEIGGLHKNEIDEAGTTDASLGPDSVNIRKSPNSENLSLPTLEDKEETESHQRDPTSTDDDGFKQIPPLPKSSPPLLIASSPTPPKSAPRLEIPHPPKAAGFVNKAYVEKPSIGNKRDLLQETSQKMKGKGKKSPTPIDVGTPRESVNNASQIERQQIEDGIKRRSSTNDHASLGRKSNVDIITRL